MSWTSRRLCILCVAGVVVAVTPALRAQRGVPPAASIIKDATNRALNDPNFDAPGSGDTPALVDALTRAGLSQDDINNVLQQIDGAKQEGAKLRGKDNSSQNGSGTAAWRIGDVMPGRTYNTNFPLTNNCRVAATVSIAYPTSIPLTGQASVTVPPKKTVSVPMSLYFSRDEPPAGNWQPGPMSDKGQIAMLPLADAITMTHPQQPGGTMKTKAGTYIYVCNAMKRTYSISATLLWYLATSDINDGPGGGGKPKPPVSKTCQHLYNNSLFIPDATHQTTQSCFADVLQQFQGDMNSTFLPLKSKNPKAWAFLPDTSALGGMSVEQILDLKNNATMASLARPSKP